MAGKDKLIVIGVDGAFNAVKSIVAGRLNASVAQLPFLVGMQAVETAQKAPAGEKVQDFTYVPTLALAKMRDVAANVFLGRERAFPSSVRSRKRRD